MDATQLVNVENLCKVLYESANDAERNHAQQSILLLQSSAEYIPQCQYILDNSTSSYALLVASNSLTKLISTHWNNFTPAQRVDIRNYVLGYLAQKGPNLEKYVSKALIQMVCRLTKLGWFDDPQHREITQEVTKFLQATVEHCILGLYILNELVIEMNQPIPGKTLTSHRKTAVSFREVALFHIFQVALTSLRQLQMRNITTERDQEARLADAALSLCIRCLSFDFIGTNPDESGEEVGALQLPSSWRVIVQEPATMQLMFDLYYFLHPPISARCLECLMLLASVRRSLFSPDTERMKFLGFLITGVRNIITNQQGLSDQQNYHEFCRLLAKCKTNYQLSELIKTDGYVQWLQLVTDFTIKSLNQWQWSSNSVTYLLGFWSRIVSAIPYVRVDHSKKDGEKSGPQLEKFVPQILSSYIQSRLKSAQQSALDLDDMYENLLDDEGSITDQMEKLQTICHYQYRSTGDTLIAAFDPLLAQYEQFVNSNPTSPQQASQIKSIEIQLAWLIHIVGGIIGNNPYSSSHQYHHHSSSSSPDNSTSTPEGGDEIIDAEICKRVFQAMQITEQRLIASGGQLKCDEHLELSILDYIHSFRKSYIGEQHGMPSPTSPPLVSTGTLSMKTKAYIRMFDHLRLGDHTVVVNMLVTKIGNNLKFWGQNSVIVGKTLNLFLDIASGYSSGKLLLSLDTVQYLLAHHTAEEFPFLSVPANTRHRTTFHATLARLLFTSVEDATERQEMYMEPILQVLQQLSITTQSYRQNESVKQAIIGVCRDLRGITMSTHNRKTYGILFEFLYPNYFPVFVRAAEEFFDEPVVMNALLKFMLEFSYNKAQRVMFDQSSPNGILLFQELSKIICAYGQRILVRPVARSELAYQEKYKGIAICMDILTRAFGGNYVNFGVFQLYNDKALENALDIVIQLVLSVSITELMAYPKVKKSYFTFLEILFRMHMVAFVCLDQNIVFELINTLHEGINSYDISIAAQCASAVDHFATFYYHQQKKSKDTPQKRAVLSLLQARPTIFSTLLSALFNILIYGEAASQWALSRPILSLTLCSEEALASYKLSISSTQSVENQKRVEESFTKLFHDIQPNLEAGNRDKFTQKLGQFRIIIRGFLTIQ